MADGEMALDEDSAALMAPGAPFEVIHAPVGGQTEKVFRMAPPNLTAVFDRARVFGDRAFIVSGQTRLTYQAFFDQSDRLAAWLIRKGEIRKGISVAIAMKNAPEWMIAFAAIVKVGAIAVLVNARGEGASLRHAVEEGDAALVIGDDRRLALLRAVGCELPMVTTGTLAGAQCLGEIAAPLRGGGDDGTDWPEGLPGSVLGSVPESVLGSVPESLPEDIACLYFTSGTTGRAKAAVTTHRALVTGTMNTQMAMAGAFAKMARAHGMSVEALKAHLPQASNLLVFPLFHTSGCSAVFLTAVGNGGRLVLMDRWDAEEALRLVEEERITSLGGVPTMLWDIVRAEGLRTRNLSSLVSISCGGQALPLKLLEALKQAFPGAVFGAGYGMTETGGAVSQANGALFLDNPQSAGQKLPMIDLRIVDDGGADVPAGMAGEIWVRGATVMQGYYGRPEATAAAFEDGWLKTGDIGYIDEGGLLYIVDRKTDMVISGGENIYCAEIEQALEAHGDVIEVAAFGLPDERLGERLVVCARTDNQEFGAGALRDFAGAQLAAYKVPKEVRLVSDPLPRNAMGKIIKSQLKDIFQSSAGL